jgi:hypothetical protein
MWRLHISECANNITQAALTFYTTANGSYIRTNNPYLSANDSHIVLITVTRMLITLT